MHPPRQNPLQNQGYPTSLHPSPRVVDITSRPTTNYTDVQKMEPADEAKILQRGHLIVFISIIALSLLSFLIDLAFLWGVAALLAVWIPICRVMHRKKKKRLLCALEEAFDGFGDSLPTLKTGMSYVFPTFTLIFRTEEAMKAAQDEGYLGHFKYSVSELYGHCGSSSRPFDVGLAVWATFEGWKPTGTTIS